MATNLQNNHDFVKQFYYCRARVLNYVLKRVNSSEDADDIVQEVFLRLLEYPGEIRPDSIQSLAFSMASHIVVDYLRRKYVRTNAQEHITESMAGVTDETEETIIGHDLENLERRRLTAMPRQRRLVYIMRMHEDKSSGEVAEALGISIRTAENHFYTGIRQMRQYFMQAILLNRISVM